MSNPSPAEFVGNGPLFDGHVLHVVDTSVVVRWGPMLRQTLRALHDSGTPTSLVTNDRELPANLEGTGVECHAVEQLAGWRAWRLGERLLARFRHPPKIVHLWGATGLAWVQRWCRRNHVPVVVHAFGVTDVAQLTAPRVDVQTRVAVASDHLAELGSQRAGDMARPWTVIPPGVALPRQSAATRTGERTLAVLCACSLDRPDAAGVLIDAIAELRRTQRDVQAVLVGAGPGTDLIWRQIHTRAVHDCCAVLDEPRLWEKGLPGADVCVVPARQGDLWLTPLLAMGLGKLVIASRDQPAQWFIEGQTAWQFTPGSAVELAYLLTRAADQPQHVQEATATASAYFDTHHSIGALLARLAALYRSIVDEGRTAGSAAAEHSGGDEHT